MATTIDNIQELKLQLEKIQNEFNASLVSNLNNLLRTNPSVETFNEKYNQFVVQAQNEANETLSTLELDDRLDIDEKALGQVSGMIDPYNRPRAGNRPSSEPTPNRSLEAGAQAGARRKPLDVFRNADESPNDRIPQAEPFNNDQINSFTNNPEPILNLKHQLKFRLTMQPRPGQKPRPEFTARALPKPRPF